MEPPFPGMDPYLESTEYWPSFHHHLAEELMTMLNEQLDPKYFADVEVRAVIDNVSISSSSDVYPDVAVIDSDPQPLEAPDMAPSLVAPLQRVALPSERTRSRTVHIYLSDTKALVTAIEILSPTNKRGRGLQQYRQKREELLFSDCHLVELDLVRRGERPGWELEDLPPTTAYVCLVNRARHDALRISDIWPLTLAQPLPTLPIPLLSTDPDITLDLSVAIQDIYRRARYARRVDYRADPPPPVLSSDDADWLDTQLRERGRRD
ncbi:MAG: DUF4058 family protein [Chloroflexi bacterium AL-W]|nr:DUF4058 family protein [Chloroflexi bacterium AL-N1]NOK70765.1 DUF4058 family protein [Chloroflexi bacterium AL-N10]NOK78325.1 DUF4058 family protein [Chloroflexi bacterium AL-N5]NOK85668.1 DUF4058 family protein [Chloroflexi bacterium AL-W]NOK92582.1 DUF4058 family protein [Chloroflexi bacterium AL-N15]